MMFDIKSSNPGTSKVFFLFFLNLTKVFVAFTITYSQPSFLFIHLSSIFKSEEIDCIYNSGIKFVTHKSQYKYK